ncbi:MAG: FAD-binding oxidoreductase, partial [Bacteroidota bacterium]
MLATFTSVEHELKSLVRGECFFDAGTRELYSTAASWYKIQPVGVVFPRDVEDVQVVIRFCYDNEIPMIPRGAGTGLAGQAVGMGIVLDFTKQMNAVLKVEENSIDVQPGLVLQTLNEQLAARGKFFPIDPASGSLCTLGGMIATNAAGAHGLKYGATKDHVESLDIVLSDGELATIQVNPPDAHPVTTFSGVYNELRNLLLPKRDLFRQQFPKVAKNSSGYNLVEATQDGNLDLRKLLVGSEGTLAVVVSATLNTTQRPGHQIGALAYFADYESTVDATVKALEFQPAAIEILDRTFFSLGLADPSARLVRPEARTMLYFEFEGDRLDELMQASEGLKESIKQFHPLEFVFLKTEQDRSAFWNLREDVSKKLNLTETFGKSSFIEDVTVPLTALPEYFGGLSKILSGHGIKFSAYGHAGAGNIHCATFVDLANQQHYRAVDLIAAEVSDLAISLGGTLSGEHGDGFVRTPFLERLYGAE